MSMTETPVSDFSIQLKSEKLRVEKELRRLLGLRQGVPARLQAAMKHSLQGGGKRLRPIILLWTWDAFSAGRKNKAVSRDDALIAACALEMIHTYSLIHDDLPAMDDDVLRRGQPTCHVAFDEPTAILAGDALQALAFQWLARAGGHLASPLVDLVAKGVGPAGMVGGQQEDLDSEGQAPTAEAIKSIHLKKTAALLGVSFGAGALLGGGSTNEIEVLEKAGQALGMAFQGADDLLDVTATTEQLGKSAGKDVAAEKVTWVQLEGLEKASKRTRNFGNRGLRLLTENTQSGPEQERLLELGSLMWNRDR